MSEKQQQGSVLLNGTNSTNTTTNNVKSSNNSNSNKMDKIDENINCEVTKSSATEAVIDKNGAAAESGAEEKIRICLIGTVVDDTQTLNAAKTFKVPVITSETGAEILADDNWTTYFVLNDFEGPMYEAIHKSKHKIVGPPALQQAVELNQGLSSYNRSIYNNAMRGVVTSFTGIKKKDELTRLVHLIHFMGGSIRKDMTSSVTHLICNASGGNKYLYAMTFKVAVVHPTFVLEAWERRNERNFSATSADFSRLHLLKAFDGQRICFFGFAPDEHQHMVEILKANGGIPTTLEDPECSHVVISDRDTHFPDAITPSRSNSPNTNLMSDENNENDGLLAIMVNDENGDDDDDEDDEDEENDVDDRLEQAKNLDENDAEEAVLMVVEDEEAKQVMEGDKETETKGGEHINVVECDLVANNVNGIGDESGSSRNSIFNICQAENDNNLNVVNDQLKSDLLRNVANNDVAATESPIRYIDDYSTPKTSKYLPRTGTMGAMQTIENIDLSPIAVPLSPSSSIVHKLKPVVLESLVNMNYDNIENIPEIKEIDEFITQQNSQHLSNTIAGHAAATGAHSMLSRKQPTDGIVLTANLDNNFLNPNNISPILKMNKIDEENEMDLEMDADDDAIDVDDEYHEYRNGKDLIKRKRPDDSFDNISLLSTDSVMLNQNYFGSAKKPKLIRTGSITRGLRRSMSFAAIKTPIANMLRSRRNSVDPNASLTSITSIETTFNESIKKPVKDKLRSIKDKIYKTPKNKRALKASSSATTIANTVTTFQYGEGNYRATSERKVSKFRSLLSSDKYKSIDECEVDNASASASVVFKTPKMTHSPPHSSNIHKHYPESGTNMLTDNMAIGGDLNLTSNINQSLSSSLLLSSSQPPSPTTLSSSPLSSSSPTHSITTTTSITTSSTTTTRTTMLSTTSTTTTTNGAALQLPLSPSASALIQEQLMTTKITATSTVHSCSNSVTIENTLCPVAETLPVVDEHAIQAKPEIRNNKTHILRAQWFWYTIQNGYANELDYQFGDYLDSIANTPGGDRRDSLPISLNNKRKRKRFTPRTPAGNDSTPVGISKRRSSVSDAGLLSVSGSFLDCTTSPDKHDVSIKNSLHSQEADKSIIEQPSKNVSMRRNHFMDLYHTESNYVGILDTIATLFKEPLEKMAETNANDALLNKSELKSIFSNFLPIHEVHKKMLNSIKELQASWSEDCLIGQIILDNRDDLIKAYPSYVNFFEQMKETLIQCDIQKPRFHAFLKICQSKPECGRQSLQDLMIRPVQRLPSISLLMNDILKHTSKSNPDHRKLDEALKAIKEVMTYINEDKRKTEGQLVMFDIFNDIDNCPPHLVSSHRSFVSRCEVTELTDSLSGRGDSLILFLFSDTLEVCKKRSRAFSNVKSPTTTTNHQITMRNNINTNNNNHCHTTVKPYKHVKLMSLSSIRCIFNISDSNRAFALNCRQTQEGKDKTYSFSICDEEVDTIIYLRSLCKQMAENACKADADKFLLSVTSQELGIDLSDINLGTLSKAFKFATRTRLKVGRAFSFNKTPSKLKRAVSTMMTSPFGSTQSLTPASQLAQMKLASCTNINEVGEDESGSSSSSPTSSEILVAPMSVQPTRRNKNPPLAVLRRI